jgi:hypothetical protein
MRTARGWKWDTPRRPGAARVGDVGQGERRAWSEEDDAAIAEGRELAA